MSRQKRVFFILSAVILTVFLWIFYVQLYSLATLKNEANLNGKYFFLGRCRVWTKTDKVELIHSFPGSYCDIVPYEGVAIVREGTFFYLQKDGSILFEKNDVYFHHGPVYDSSRKIIWTHYSQDYILEKGQNKGETSLVSGVRGYDLSGNLIVDLDTTEIMNFLKDNGVKLAPYVYPDGNDWMEATGLKSRSKIVFTNSLSLVDKSVRGTDFNKDDLILNIRRPSGAILFDGKSFRPKKWFPYLTEKDHGEIESHHPIVDGNNLLVFLNHSLDEEGHTYARVASFDIHEEKMSWFWSINLEGKPIISPSHGGIFKIHSGLYLVYTHYEGFLSLLDTKNFQVKNLVELKEFSGDEPSRYLVNVKFIPYEWLIGFRIQGYDLLEKTALNIDDWVLGD